MRKKPHFKTAGGRDSTATTNTNRANISVRSACILPTRHTDSQMILSSTMTCDPPRFFRFHYAIAFQARRYFSSCLTDYVSTEYYHLYYEQHTPFKGTRCLFDGVQRQKSGLGDTIAKTPPDCMFEVSR